MNGTYLEVGAFQPKFRSNTYLLEVENNWRGLSIELNKSLKQEWKKIIFKVQILHQIVE